MDNNTDTIMVRVRLTADEAGQFETVRQFLGLPSVSQTVARLALWNCRVLAESLRNDGKPEAAAEVLSGIGAEVTKLGLRSALLAQK